MNIDANGFPLSWPAGWPRTPTASRKYGHFHTIDYTNHRKVDVTVAGGVERVLSSLKRMGVPDFQVIISTNLQLRRDGLPRSDQRAPTDPGAAVYWLDGQEQRRIATDLYDKVEDNLAAIAATLEAMRAIERHGGAQILNRAFAGFTALPAPGQTTRTWRDVLGLSKDETSLAKAQENYRRLAGVHHPDKGGSSETMAELNSAWTQAQEALK